MSSVSEILFNYNKAIQQADQLEDVAKKLKNAANQNMEGVLNDISKAWESDSAPQYIQKGKKVKGDMLTSANNLQKIANAIRTIATEVRNAELEARRIGNARR